MSLLFLSRKVGDVGEIAATAQPLSASFTAGLGVEPW
jgi:hypothetical protein